MTFEWGKRLIDYTEEESCVVACFDDGSTMSADLIIGMGMQ